MSRIGARLCVFKVWGGYEPLSSQSSSLLGLKRDRENKICTPNVTECFKKKTRIVEKTKNITLRLYASVDLRVHV